MYEGHKRVQRVHRERGWSKSALRGWKGENDDGASKQMCDGVRKRCSKRTHSLARGGPDGVATA